MGMSGRLLRPRQSLHAETANWVSRVVANGGTVSGSTVAAVDRFVNAIHAAGIRDRFYRLNLFCGNSDASLNAVRTPLYRGPSLGGTQFGNTTDTNANFVAADYSEASGLKGNGSTKSLLTGLLPGDMGGPLHVAVSVQSDATNNTFSIGCDNAFDSGWTTCGLDYANAALAGGGATGLRPRGAMSSNAGSLGEIVSASSAFRILTTSARTTGAAQITYQNGALIESRSPTYTTHPAFAFFVFATNRKGTAVGHCPVRLSSYSAGLQMTGTQVAAYNTAIVAFLTALGRPTS